MSEQAEVATAEVDVFNGQQPTMAEYNQYRSTGELPERFKPAEPSATATDDTQKQTETEGEHPESAADSETAIDSQEQKPKKPQTAAERIAQLDAKIESLWGEDEPDTIKIAQLEATKEKIEQRAGMKRKTEVAPVTPKPAAVPEGTRPKPTVDAKDDKGNPKYSSYEDYVEDLADWKAEQRQAEFERKLAIREQQRELNAKMDDARTRYQDFDSVIKPRLDAVIQSNQITPVAKAMLGDSEVLPDVLYALDLDELSGLSPSKQLRYIAAVEAGVIEELGKPSVPRDEQGKFKSAASPEPKKTAAPPPPKPVGGTTARGFDVNDETLSAEEWARKRNEDLRKQR